MIDILVHFCIGFVTSFLGSIPLGAINAAVVRLSITANLRAAYTFIAGVTIAEFFYSYIAVFFSTYLLSFHKLEFYIQIITIPVFILIGWTYFNAKPREKEEKETTTPTSAFFVQGLTIGFLNPLQIPFWLAYGTYFMSNGWIKNQPGLLFCFIIGIIAGSSTLLLLLAKSALHFSKKFKTLETKINVLTGCIFFFLAFYQLVVLVLK